MTADVDHLVVAAASNEQGVAGIEATLGIDAGRPLAASRETPQGRLQWQILVRDDGVLPHEGALPTLIQWQGPHPTEALPASGVELRALQLAGVPAAARQGAGAASRHAGRRRARAARAAEHAEG